jgi:hypothetical protein
VAPNGERRKLANEQAGESQASRLFRRSWLREWRRNKIDRSRFLEVKRRYRERRREKKKQKREREEKEIKEIRTEREVWRLRTTW